MPRLRQARGSFLLSNRTTYDRDVPARSHADREPEAASTHTARTIQITRLASARGHADSDSLVCAPRRTAMGVGPLTRSPEPGSQIYCRAGKTISGLMV